MPRQRLSAAVLAALAACGPTAPAPPADVTERLGPGEVRAGVIDDEAALSGGVAADGAAGDVKIYNDRVAFVIQGLRDGHFYVAQGGGVIDADVVRPEGAPGRDLVEDWGGMFGLGRLLDPERLTVMDDGALSGRAIVRVEGREIPLELLTGSLGSDALVPDLGLQIRTDYALEADSPLLQVTTTLTAGGDDVAGLAPGDLLLSSLDAGAPWHPGSGWETPDGDLAWSGFVGDRGEVALAVFPGEGALVASGTSDLLRSLIDFTGGFGEAVDIDAGASLTWRRYYGVGPDLAALTDAWLAETGVTSEPYAGEVTAPDGPVAGALVTILIDGDPWTMAVTDAEGRFEAQIPAGADATALADGRGTGRWSDLPPGAAGWSPYATDAAREAALASFEGALDEHALPEARGRGAGSDAAPLALGSQASLTIRVADGLPFEARVAFIDADVEVDPRLVRDRPSGYAALAWARDGEVSLALEPGRYALWVQRGGRYALHSEEIELTAGAPSTIELELAPAWTMDGWWVADPHSHSAPSGDGEISARDRLITMASAGVQVHFGTEHDHVVDYRSLLGPLGLEGVLASVVADELSPVIQGHVNVYPATRDPSMPNGGAFLWWREPFEDTEDLFAQARARNPGALLQLNHPLDSGVASAAGWSEGRIDAPERWSDDFDAVEVLNSGDVEALDFYLDLVNRGILTAPVGVSDSHGHLSGGLGRNVTLVYAPGLELTGDTDPLIEAIAARRTVVTNGPALSLSILPGETITAPTELTAEALAPDWIQVDRLHLMRDGEVVETVEGDAATFLLEADADASFAVLAEGDAPMEPFTADLPWAFSSPILLDLDGDGWDPPLAPLELSE